MITVFFCSPDLEERWAIETMHAQAHEDALREEERARRWWDPCPDEHVDEERALGPCPMCSDRGTIECPAVELGEHDPEACEYECAAGEIDCPCELTRVQEQEPDFFDAALAIDAGELLDDEEDDAEA